MYEEELPNIIYEEMRKYLTIYEERPPVIYDFATASSEFPFICGKFYFLFYQCISQLVPAIIHPRRLCLGLL
jgi:hypothetical protein